MGEGIMIAVKCMHRTVSEYVSTVTVLIMSLLSLCQTAKSQIGNFH